MHDVILSRHPHIPELQLAHVMYLYEIQGKSCQVLIEINRVNLASLSFYDRYLIYKTKFLLLLISP